MPEFMYQTLQVENRMPFKGGTSARGTAIGAGVKLLKKAFVALNEWGVSHTVNREIKARASEIERQMPPKGGVLLCVGIQEWAAPDFTGDRAQLFLSLHIAGGGTDPADVLRHYLMQPRLVRGVPKGWRRGDVFVWVTPSAPPSPETVFIRRFLRSLPGPTAMTLSMQERALAIALFEEHGKDSRRVEDVFRELDDNYNSDADDVAEIYVNLLMKRSGGPLEAVKRSPSLRERLIKILDEGWTSSGERKCVDFLRRMG